MKTFKTLDELHEYNNKGFEQTIGSVKYQRPENPLEKNSWDALKFNARPHDVFKLDWSSYSSLRFGDTFLPYIRNGYKGKALWMYDGAELFNDLRKTDRKLFKFDNSKYPIYLITYTYPKGVSAESKKNIVRVTEHEVLTFIEVDKYDNMDVSFKFGKRFKNYLVESLRGSSKSANTHRLENGIYKTDVDVFKKHFEGELVHDTMMKFILKTLGIDFNEIKELNKLFEFDNYEIDMPSLQSSAKPQCSDDFLADFKKFIQFPKVIAKNIDCEVQFYRSEEQSKGKYSKDDKGYTGSFGFDRYNEKRSGTGQLSVKYFPNIINIDETYKAPFISIWAPKSRFSSKIKTSAIFKPINKIDIWLTITQNKKNKDITKNYGNLYFDTGTSDVVINGKQKGNLYKNSSNVPFNVGDNHKFTIECKNIIRDYVFITFKETDQSGKVVGVLNVVPNNKVYTTNVKLIDVALSTNDSLKNNTVGNSLAKPLEKYFNETCFNQAFIITSIEEFGQKMTINKGQLPSVLKDDFGKNYVPQSRKDEFHKTVLGVYNNLLDASKGTTKEKDYAEISKIINRIDTSKASKSAIDKRQVIKKAESLIKTMIKVFKRHKKNEFRIKETYNDPDVIKAINEYNIEVQKYRQELYGKTEAFIDSIARFRNSPSLAEYKLKIQEAIFQNKEMNETKSPVSANTSNDIYMFMYKGIEAFKDLPTEKQRGIAGFTTTGDGYVHMLDLAISHKTKRNEIIAHEVGHSFGLKHTFEYNQKSIDRDYQQEIQKLEKEKKEQLSPKKKSANFNAKVLEDRIYSRLEREYKKIKDNFNFVKNSSLAPFDRIISANFINTYIGIENKVRGRTPLTNAQKVLEFKNKKDVLDNNRLRKLEKILNIQQSLTKENFMDYDLDQRKSFWYWQWLEMHCNLQPLKEYIL